MEKVRLEEKARRLAERFNRVWFVLRDESNFYLATEKYNCVVIYIAHPKPISEGK